MILTTTSQFEKLAFLDAPNFVGARRVRLPIAIHTLRVGVCRTNRRAIMFLSLLLFLPSIHIYIIMLASDASSASQSRSSSSVTVVVLNRHIVDYFCQDEARQISFHRDRRHYSFKTRQFLSIIHDISGQHIYS